MDSYYINQAGSGLGGFSGHRYQKGDGFFGRLIAGTVLPLIKKALPFLGKAALNTGVDIVRDVAEGQQFKESLKRRIRKTGDNIADKAISKVKEITGGGRGKKSKSRKNEKPYKKPKRAQPKKQKPGKRQAPKKRNTWGDPNFL